MEPAIETSDGVPQSSERASEHPLPLPLPLSRTPAAAAEGALGVLLVDDRPEQLLALEAILEGVSAPHDVVSVRSGKDALRQLLQRDFAVILLDVQMPIVDGFETAELIRQRERSRHTPIIFLTGVERADAQIFRGYSLGAVDYVLKPLVPEVIRAKVCVFLELARKTRLLETQAELLRKSHDELVELTNSRTRLLEELEISTTLADSLDLGVTLKRVADLGAAHLADRCTVEIVDEEGEVLVATSDAPGDSRSPAPSPVSVPLVARGRTIGVMTLASARARSPDERLAEEFAHRAALAIDNALLYRAAGDAVRARDDFLCVASHELRTPLTPLKLLLDALRRTATRSAEVPSDQLLERVAKIQRQFVRMERFVDHLLDLSRISARRLTLEVEELDLARTVAEVADRAEAEFGPSSPPIRVVGPASVPGRWDRLRLEQVIANLLSNAQKYGGGEPIEVGIAESETRVRFWVRDQGPGVPEEHQRRIFGRFERAVSARKAGGLGLGLWIVKQIVTAHGGSVHLDSAPAAGATFSVDLPRQTPSRAP